MAQKKPPDFKAGERVTIGGRTGTIAGDHVPREGGLIPIDLDDATRASVDPAGIERLDKTLTPPARAQALTQKPPGPAHKMVEGPTVRRN